MKITINNEAVEVQGEMTLHELLLQEGFPEKGIAVAVDNKVVSRAQWGEFIVPDGAKVTVIKAVCGG